MLSPLSFVGGASSDPFTHNSCPTGWGNITLAGSPQVECAGTTGVAGTGRWKWVSTHSITNTDNTTTVDEVLFQRNADHWDAPSSDSVEFMTLKRHATHDAVKAALLAGTLDVVVGDGVLAPADVMDMQYNHTTTFHVSLTEPLQNRIIIFNTARAPTDNLQNRKVMIHAVDKATIIQSELAGLADPVDSLFPKTAPYCHVDLTPRWDYDLEKAQLLNCASMPASADTLLSSNDDNNDDLPSWGVGLIAIVAAAFIASAAFVIFMVKREKAGNPLFKVLMIEDEMAGGTPKAKTVTGL